MSSRPDLSSVHVVPEPFARVDDRHGGAAFVRTAAIVTMALYSTGHGTIGFVLLLGAAVWRLMDFRAPLWHPTPLDRPLAAFAAVLMLSAIASPHRLVALEVTLLLFISGSVYFGSFSWLLKTDPGSRVTLLRAWVLGGPFAAVIGMLSGAIAHRRAYFPWGASPNTLGTTLLLASLLGIGLGLCKQGRARILWLGCGLVSLAGLLATGTRSALAGWLVGAAYLTWRELRGRPARLALAALGGAAVLALAGVLELPFIAQERHDAPADLGDRPGIWRTSVRMFTAHPLLGTGFGTFQTVFEALEPAGTKPVPYAHNLWLNIAVETGILGLLGALWIAWTGSREWVRRGRPASITALWAGLLVDQFLDNTVFSIGPSAGVWLLLALLVIPPAGSGRGDAREGPGGRGREVI